MIFAPTLTERPRKPLDTELDKERPWPGLDFYTEQTREYFHGRDEEVDRLLGLVRHARLTVLCSLSGLGKSSLLQAGLMPSLRRDGRLPIYVRLSHAESASEGQNGLLTLLELTRECIKAAVADSLNRGDVILAADAKPTDPLPKRNESIWRYLHRRDFSLRMPEEDATAIAPVIIFDQFEELFTVGAANSFQQSREEFLRDLADCVENREPEDVIREIKRFAQRADGHDAIGDPNSYAELSGLDIKRNDYRIVISLREDYLAAADELSFRIPSMRGNRLRLGMFTYWKALDAVAIPGEELLEPIVARQIVECVASSRREGARTSAGTTGTSNGVNGLLELGEEKLLIDPALLSMFCRELNEERLLRGEAKITPKLTDEFLKDAGRGILSRFYGKCFDDLGSERDSVQKFVEDELLTMDGYRGVKDLNQSIAKLRQMDVSNPARAIGQLVQRRLLRIFERAQDHTKWVELTHDVLCDVIGESKRNRELRDDRIAEEQRQKEEAQQLLTEAERKKEQAERLQQSAERERLEAERARLRAINDQLQAERKTLRAEGRLKKLFIVVAAVAVILLLGTVLYAKRMRDAAIGENEKRYQRSQELVAKSRELLGREDWLRASGALNGAAMALRVSPENRAAAGLAGELLLERNWCVPLTAQITIPRKTFAAAAITPGGRYVAAVDKDAEFHLWEINASGYTLSKVPHPALTVPETVQSAVFSENGAHLLVSYKSGWAQLLDWNEKNVRYEVRPDELKLSEWVVSAAWSNDGSVVVVVPWVQEQTSYVRVYRKDATGFYSEIFTAQNGFILNVSAADVTSDGAYLATMLTTGEFQKWTIGERLIPDSDRIKMPTKGGAFNRPFSAALSASDDVLAVTTMGLPPSFYRIKEAIKSASVPFDPEANPRDLKIPIGVQTMRVFYKGERAYVGMAGMITAFSTENLADHAFPPLPFVGSTLIVPAFDEQGDRMVTLSGPSWMVTDTIRLWRTKIPPGMVNRPATDDWDFGKIDPPSWLSDLAAAIAARASDEDFRPLKTLGEIEKEYGKDVPESGPYREIWNRFFR